MSDEQRSIQERLVARYERIRSQKVDPREDNALAITTDGRKLALDARLISGEVPRVLRVEDQRPGRAGRGHLATHGGGQRHAARLLRPGREPDAVGLLGLRGAHREARRGRHPPLADRRRRATPRATRRSRPSSSGCGRARCGCSSARRRRWARGPTCSGGSSPSITSTPRGSRPRSSSGRAESCGRGTRTRRSSSSGT